MRPRRFLRRWSNVAGSRVLHASTRLAWGVVNLGEPQKVYGFYRL